jgi:hypothetical protein
MSDALKESPHPPFLRLVTPGGKRKEVSSAAEVGQLVAESTSKKARRETSQSPVPSNSLSPEGSDHEDTGTGKKAEPVTAEPQPEDAEAELSASVTLLNEFKPKTVD